MTHFLLLTVCTSIIVFLAYKVWCKTKYIGFMLGFFFLYYWSLLGAWFVVFDSMTNNLGRSFGVDYYPYFEKLFPVRVDGDYLLAISYYALFIIVVQVFILVRVKQKNKEIKLPEKFPISINHNWIMLLCLVCTTISLFIIREEILIAAKFHHSVYYVTRMHHGSFFTIHQLLNQVSISALFIGLVTFFSEKEAIFLKGNKVSKLTPYLYVLTVLLVEGYLLFIGNKREIFFGGILGVLFYLHNSNFKIHYKKLALFLLIIITPLVFNDGLRSISPTALTKKFDVSEVKLEFKEKVVYTEFSAQNTVSRFIFSNEMFVPHFSMYGVVSKKIPLTYGTSIISLFSSFVPRVIWPNRPPPIYQHYVDQVGAKKGTGYTIHHATGWYLNFGVIGIIMGALLLASIWSFLYQACFYAKGYKGTFLPIVFIIGLSAFIAQLPTIIRSGPEGYKALIFEGLILPSLIIYCSAIIPTLIKKKL